MEKKNKKLVLNSTAFNILSIHYELYTPLGTETWQQIRMDIICPQPVSESCAIAISELLLQEGSGKNKSSSPMNLRKLRPTNGTTGPERCSPVDSRRRINAEFFSSSRSSDYSFLPSAQGMMLPPRRQATTPNSCNLSFLKEISKLSQMNLSRLAQSSRCSYQMLDSNESIHNVDEMTNEDISQSDDSAYLRSSRFSSTSSNGVLREVSSLVNTPLTPSDAAKLVYLEDEEAPICGDDYPTVQPTRVNASQNRNRRSYPLANSVRFANPLVTPEEPCSEITSDYASCENIHKLLSSANRCSNNGLDKVKVASKEAVISFTNPNYLTSVQQMVCMEEKIGRGDYVKLNSPADSLLEDSGCVEMTEFRRKPPRSLALSGDNFDSVCEKRKKYRACSAGRYDRHDRQAVTSVCIFLVGGKEQCQITTFKKPISVWKLSLTKDVY